MKKFEQNIQKIFEAPTNRTNCSIELINSIVELQFKFFEPQRKYIQVEIQTLFESCGECENFVDILIKAKIQF